MGNGFWMAVGQMCQLCFWTVRYFPKGSWRKLPRRTLTFGLAIPVLVFFQLIHWLGFTIDDVIFRRYRKISIKQPVFISGIPRSGTTHLQRVLVDHENLTSMQTWECVLAPSITERYCYSLVGFILRPVAGLIGRIPFQFMQRMESIHKLGLKEAEEDFIALLPINACFLLVVFFPHVDRYWRLSQFDSQLSASSRHKVLKYYRRMIQRHLYFHGEDLRYISKNPSFLTWSNSLANEFPDCSIVLCERPADKTVPSQISSLEPIWKLIYGESMSGRFKERIVMMLSQYYQYLEQLNLSSVNAMRLPMNELVGDLQDCVERVLQHCDLPITERYRLELNLHVVVASRYESSHSYKNKSSADWQYYKTHFSASAQAPIVGKE